MGGLLKKFAKKAVSINGIEAVATGITGVPTPGAAKLAKSAITMGLSKAKAAPAAASLSAAATNPEDVTFSAAWWAKPAVKYPLIGITGLLVIWLGYRIARRKGIIK